jgi:transcriptional regulator with XRE-family HTH domain
MTPAALVRPTLVRFGYLVRRARLAAKLTQGELAERARMTRNFIGGVEHGRENPSLATMVLLAHGLGCDLADLIPPRDSRR